MPDWLGKTIGRVRIDKLLAQGGMAEVYLGTHLTLERPVAIKLLHSYIEEEPLLLERFHREAKVVAALRHPNIVQIFDFDAVDGRPYIVMEYLNGPTLAKYLTHLHQRKKRIPQDQVARLLKNLSEAVDYAHEQGVIHRDIKPGNIVLHNKSDAISLDQPLTNDVEPIVTDFGLVRVMNAATQTMSGIVSGTPAYMSPEQARGDEIDRRTDIYSLGAVLYEMLAGRVPFQADNTLSVLHMHIYTPPPPIPGIPAKVKEVVDRALAKNPDDRYQTSEEMADDFYRSIGVPQPVSITGSSYTATPGREEAPSREEAVTVLPPQPVAEPSLKPQPRLASEVPPKLKAQTASKPTTKSQPRIQPEATHRPTRNMKWMGVGLLTLVLVALVAWGANRLRSVGALLPKTASASSPIAPSAAVSPLPSESPAIPSSEGMVSIPAGTYEVGTDLFTDDYHVPSQNISLGNFWVDKYLITNAQYQKYMTDTGTSQPVTWPGQENHPVTGVTWDQALAYCQWVHKRLSNEAEWEAAGRGAGSSPPLYPWGNDATAGGQALLLPDDDTYPVGTQSFNKSSTGVFDMVGNVWEWVGQPYETSQEGIQILRGGRYGLPINDLAYRLVVAAGDTRYLKYAGFRCAADQVK